MSSTDRIINPYRYEYYLKGEASCNYGLNSHSMYRTLAREEQVTTPLTVEAFFKYDYNDFRIDYAFRTFPYTEDERIFNVFMVTNKGVYKEDITRSILDNDIYMRWSTFITKLITRPAQIFVTNTPDTKQIIWFSPSKEKSRTNTKIIITDTDNIDHEMTLTAQIQESLKYGTDYVDVPKICYIPIWDFHMWHMMF